MKSAFFLSGIYCSAGLLAQQSDTLQIQQAEIHSSRLQIAANDINRNMQIIDAKTIAQLPAKSIAELLTYAAGVDVRQRGPWGTQSDISIQGGTFDQALIMVNGIRMSDPQTGHHQMNLPIAIEMIERIEILKGPAARQYGLNAISGAINIITKNPDATFASLRTYAGISPGTTDTLSGDRYRNVGISGSVGFKLNNTGVSISGSHDEGNGFRYNTAYKNDKVYALVNHKINKKHTVTAQGGWTKSYFGANNFYAAPRDTGSKEAVETALAAVAHQMDAGNWKLITALTYRYNYDHYVFRRFQPSFYQNRHFSHTIQPSINFTRHFSFGKLGIGAEWRSVELRSSNLGNRREENTGITAEFLYSKHSNFTLLAGMYMLYNSRYGSGFFPGIEMGYKLNENLKLFANSGLAQRLPTFTDLYYQDPVNSSNPNLKPEKSFNAETGIKWFLKKSHLQLSLFSRDISNMIDWVRDSANAKWQPVNYSTVRCAGVEIQTRRILYSSSHSKWLNSLVADVNYTWLNQSFLKTQENKLSKYSLENLNHQLVAALQVTAFKNLQFRVAGRYLVRSNMNAYTVVDLRMGYDYKSLNVFVDFNNIFNEQYREISAVPMPPRWISVGLKYNLQNVK